MKRYLEFTYKCKLQGIKQRLKAKAKPEAEALPDALTKPKKKQKMRDGTDKKESKAEAKSKSYNKAKISPICTGDPYFTGLDQTPNVPFKRTDKKRKKRGKRTTREIPESTAFLAR